MTIIGIDPGTTHSGVVIYRPEDDFVVESHAEMLNSDVRTTLRSWLSGPPVRVVCEWIQAMGMIVGREVFETCRFIGRLEEITESNGREIEYIQRPTVKTRLCGMPRAKDPQVRAALIERFGGESAIGNKKQPGPLYTVKSHAWSALAVAVAIDLK